MVSGWEVNKARRYVMSRVLGKTYSSSTLSGYQTKEEAEQYVLTNYSLAPVEVQKVGSDFIFYFEDENGELYGPGPGYADYSPEGVTISMTYTVDENGFQPTKK
jgi:hypothetical protein